MAEAAPEPKVPITWSSQVQCRYYLHGICQKGDGCQYRHDLSAKPSNICKFYLRGTCTFGDKCRYDHIKPKPSQPQKTNKQNNKGTSLKSDCGKHHLPKPMHLPAQSTDAGRARMVTLKKSTQSSPDSGIGEELPVSPIVKNPDQWAQAAEFVPGQQWKGSMPGSYLEAAQSGIEALSLGDDSQLEDPHPYLTDEEKRRELCPYAKHGECRYGDHCVYLHADVCDLCGRAALHPLDTTQRTSHTEECIKQHEKDMELSFAVAQSKGKACGICMEVIVEKSPKAEQRFGLLSNCNHVFCLSCIRKWRSAKQFDNKLVRSCPECRVKSDFVTPSKYWVEDRNEKLALIAEYKKALSEKACKYFDQGRGECPFGPNCFYLHAYPDGRKASPKPVRRRRRQNGDGDLDLIQQIILWDFLEEHRRRLTFEISWEDDLEEFLFSAGLWDSSSDESDFSDFS